MYYQQLFELNILHEYYQNQVCSDLSIEPTQECRKILNGHRLILKSKANGIKVIAPVNSAKKLFIDLAENLSFSFILKIDNLDFINFTELNFNLHDNYVLFGNKNVASNTKQTLEANILKRNKLDLPTSENILGTIEIDLMSIGLEGLNTYEIIFKPKKKRWYYYLVTDSKTKKDDFSIGDRESNRTPKIEFKPTKIESGNKIANSIARQFPNSKQYLFASNSEIACQELGIKNIQLAKKGEHGTPTVWIEHLPNPPNNSGVQIVNTLKQL